MVIDPNLEAATKGLNIPTTMAYIRTNDFLILW